MYITDAVLSLDLEFLHKANITGTKNTLPNSDKKHFWGVAILLISKKLKYQILELLSAE